MEGYIDKLHIHPLSSITLEGILGANGHQNKLALTLRAELVSRLMTIGGKVYCPKAIVKASIKTILMVEHLNEPQREQLKALLA